MVRSIKVTLLTLETRQLFGWGSAFVTSIYKLFNWYLIKIKIRLIHLQHSSWDKCIFGKTEFQLEIAHFSNLKSFSCQCNSEYNWIDHFLKMAYFMWLKKAQTQHKHKHKLLFCSSTYTVVVIVTHQIIGFYYIIKPLLIIRCSVLVMYSMCIWIWHWIVYSNHFNIILLNNMITMYIA